ncbi:unnamed protein product, partial [Brassica oleracea var. botrytis]
LCVVLLRQLLCTSVSLQRREIHAFSETVFNCSQNPLVGFFNVNFDFSDTKQAFFLIRTRCDTLTSLIHVPFSFLLIYTR